MILLDHQNNFVEILKMSYKMLQGNWYSSSWIFYI